MTQDRKIAFVTGASRGIGKAIALALAEIGHDLILSARTRTPGEARDNSLSVHKSDTRPLPGSLAETAAEVEALGRRALQLPFDLTDRASVGAAAQHILDQPDWRDVSVIVHNGRYIGPGLMDVFMDTPLDAYGRFVEAHLVAPVILTRMLLPAMLERGGGTVVTITSSAGYQVPPAPAGQGGWGLAYAVGKAAGHQLAGTLHAEYAARGIRAFNVQPGFVATERNHIAVADYGKELRGAAPPAAIGAVIQWLLTSDEAAAHAGANIEAQQLCRERGLHPAWD
ncbi:MAG TPA: SDR family NAD(P)-dependent oxidoreductase [Sphingopyxis sp.]|nr:SDR family NAD(P)-dependent oxidoreductase [Sphingopyxis sp.]HMP44376.1 SDR family NAD(P)-dependent oxidoreductase [Sphingopyxis sp.]HMQ18531.1 SDR family NAD(P)-dependent oxidoreductase [Sphingopyxis sp.]